MASIELLGVGSFLLAYYYLVLRKYNTLGFRMFSLFFFIGTCMCYWWYTAELKLKEIRKNGVSTLALVTKKTNNSLEFRITDPLGKAGERIQTGGISVEEFAVVREGHYAPVLYSPKSETVYLTTSYQRQSRDNVYVLFFPGIFFLIGIVSWIILRKYRVHAREGSIMEYVTDETGKIVLDDAQNSTTKSLRTYSTVAKFLQILER